MKEAWTWLLSKLLENLPATPAALACTYTNLEVLKMEVPADTLDQECTWLLGNYCCIVATTVTGRKRKLGAEGLAGRVRGCLQNLRHRRVIQPQIFNII